MSARKLFNRIAPVYGLFYHFQKRHFERIVKSMKDTLDLTSYTSILDVGCGTGAFCSVMHSYGLAVTGVDVAEKMLRRGAALRENKGVHFLHGDALNGLPFEDNAFDIVTASYVSHGLEPEARKQLYAEMSRLARDWVLIHDYNEKRSWLTDIVEWLERGDYFRFIRQAEKEMRSCVVEEQACFVSVKKVNVGPRAAWYICKPFGRA